MRKMYKIEIIPRRITLEFECETVIQAKSFGEKYIKYLTENHKLTPDFRITELCKIDSKEPKLTKRGGK